MIIRRVSLALLALCLLPAPAARADVAGNGTFDIILQPSLPNPNVPFHGNITFEDIDRMVLGQPVNLFEDVGDMTFEGNAVVNFAAESATFDVTAESDVDFDFAASGAGSCASSGCLGGNGTFAGRFTTINDPHGVLPDGVLTFDGTAAINGAGQGPGGAFAINAFPRVPTPSGSDVEVSSGAQTFYDTVAKGVRSFLVTARFANVGPQGGDTEFVAFSALPGVFPAGINFNGMVISVFVDIATNATVTGNVRVCIGYPDGDHDGIVDTPANNISETRLRVLYATQIGQPFTDVTVSVGNERACGDVPNVGPVFLGVAPAGATTTTISPTTTSTSVAPESTTTTSTVPSGESTTTSTSSPVPTSTSTSTSSPGPTSTSTSTSLPAPVSTTTTTTPTLPSTTTSIVVSPSTSTTSTTLPICTAALECIDIAIAGPLCPGTTLNQKLAAVILKKLAKAKTALLAARGTSVAKKAAKQIGRAQKQLDKIGTKADAFVSKPKGAISPECRDLIRAATGLVTQQIEANRI